MNKPQLRHHFRRLRENLAAEEISVASAALCRRLAGWPVLRDAQTVLTYLAFKNEPDLGLLFDLLPDIRWVVPRIEGQRLILHPYAPSRLIRHSFGMLEPAADAPVVDAAKLNLVLTPGVAFDRRGGRLGFGGGFYDQFLVTTPALRVGVTYDECLAEELPCSDYDQRMDWVVTPTREIHCAPLWKAEPT